MWVDKKFNDVRRQRRTALVAAVAACTAVSIGLGLAGPALAVDPGRLRDGCVWRTADEEAEHIQTCTFYSTSLGEDVTVQVRPSSNAPGSAEQGVYFLDGLGSNPEYSTWSLPDAGAVASYSTEYNLVMPAGGAGEWMTNWQQAPTGSTTAPQWDTFVGEELPAYLNENFDIGTTDNAIVGVSMSGASAVVIGLNHPDVFSVIRSYSGYYQTDSPFGWLLIPFIQSQRAGIDNGLSAMWGLPLSQGNVWADNDVSKRITEAEANGQTVITSSGDGIPTLHELSIAAALITQTWEQTPEQLPALLPAALSGLALGIGLEAGAFVSTLALAAQTTLQGLPISYHFSNGTHNWYAWAADAPSDAQAIEDALQRSRESSAEQPTVTASTRASDESVAKIAVAQTVRNPESSEATVPTSGGSDIDGAPSTTEPAPEQSSAASELPASGASEQDVPDPGRAPIAEPSSTGAAVPHTPDASDQSELRKQEPQKDELRQEEVQQAGKGSAETVPQGAAVDLPRAAQG